MMPQSPLTLSLLSVLLENLEICILINNLAFHGSPKASVPLCQITHRSCVSSLRYHSHKKNHSLLKKKKKEPSALLNTT